MSNNSLITRIEPVLASVRARQSTAQCLARAIRNNGRALELMPYPLIRELEDLAMDLDIAAWHDGEGFLPDLDSILPRVDRWLRQIQQDAPNS